MASPLPGAGSETVNAFLLNRSQARAAAWPTPDLFTKNAGAKHANRDGFLDNGGKKKNEGK